MNFLSRMNQISKSRIKQTAHLKLRSSMTIYLTLVLIVIMALIFTLIESGRVSAMNAKARSMTFMAADSSFAEFAEPVFDRYGILALWTDEESFLKTMNSYITENLDLKGSGAGMDMELYGLRYEGSEMQTATWLTDHDGQPFAEQVEDYMKVHIAEGLMETLLSRTDFFEQTETVREVLGKINEYRKEFVELEQNVTELNDKMNHIKDLAENPKTLFEEMNAALENYEGEPSSEAAETFESKRNELEQSRDELRKELEDAGKITGEYYQNVEAAKAGLKEMKEELDLDEEAYDPEIYQAIQNKIKEIEDAGSEDGAGYQEIRDNQAAAEKYLEKLNQLDTYFEETGAGLNEENAAAFRALTTQYQSSLAETDLSALDLNGAAPEAETADTGFITTVNELNKVGVLELFAGEVSDKQIDTSGFPSVQAKKNSGENKESAVDKTIQKALFSEYIAEHFGNFRNVKEDTALDYEAEYIFAGKDNDRDNLRAVVTDLVLIRSGADMVSLLLDSTKQAEIRELAAAVSCGQVYIYKIAELLITFAWALAEGMLDTRALLEGKKVAVLKQEGDWFLSLEGLKNFSGEETLSSDEQKGLGYEDYLRILLLMENRSKQRFRTMDMIQADMCLYENPEFCIKDCLVATRVEVSFQAPNVFMNLPLSNRDIAAGSGGYQMRFSQEYAY